ncbi:MAG: ferrous iron transporter B [Deltaproteobacteria bacterium]|nr:ferrous iron transporter B [Deltaproteobacteria bacterium]
MSKARRIVLVGNPNVGKSVIFGALTGKYATVSNFPGTTVEIARGALDTARSRGFSEVVDTPGTNNLVPSSEDEAVTRDILLGLEVGDVVVQVADAKNLARALVLTIEMAELEVPQILVLNMIDEAEARGVAIGRGALSEVLGVPVVETVATRREGISGIWDALGKAAVARVATRYPEAVEFAVTEMGPLLPAELRGRRGFAAMLVAGDRTLDAWSVAHLSRDSVVRIAEIERSAAARLALPVFATMNAARVRDAEAMAARASEKRVAEALLGKSRRTWGARIAAVVLTVLASYPTAVAIDAAARRIAAIDASTKLPDDPLDALGFGAVFLERIETIGGWVFFAILLLFNALLFARARPTMRAVMTTFAAQAIAYVVFYLAHTILWASGVASVVPEVSFAIVATGLLAAFTVGRARFEAPFLRVVSRSSMHPVWGVPFLIVVLLVTYKFVGGFGAKTAVDFLQNDVFGKVVGSRTVTITRGAPGANSRWIGEPLPDGSEKPLGAYLSSDVRTLNRVEALRDGKATIAFRFETVLGKEVAPYIDGAVSAYVASGSGSLGAVVRGEPGEVRVEYAFAEGEREARVEIRNWRGFLNRLVYGAVQPIPFAFVRDLVSGPYGVVTMALTYAIALILPIILTFFLAFSVLEDSGYLPRLAVMVNKLFRVIGLNGKAVLPMVLGLGCDTMATTTTRILETRKERILVTLLLALGVPCSAQLGVILAMLATLSFATAMWWVGAVVLVMLAVGFIAAKVIPGRTSDLILELPPLRRPEIANIVIKTVGRVEWYLKEAVPLFVIATLFLFLFDKLNLLGGITRALEPVVVTFLGLPSDAAEAFLIGFLRRDFGATKLFDMSHREVLGSIQVVVAMTTITLFIPCVANVLMIVKERGWKVATGMVAFIFPLAFGVGGLLNAVMPRGEPAGALPVAVAVDGDHATIRVGPVVDADNNRLPGAVLSVKVGGREEKVVAQGGVATLKVARNGASTESVEVSSIRGAARGTGEIRFAPSSAVERAKWLAGVMP